MPDDPRRDEQGRPRPPRDGDEVATLLGFLDLQRATLEWKCGGLDDGQLRARLHPSALTLGGMLKHLAYVEDWWFTECVAGQPAPAPWAGVDWAADNDWDWHSADAEGGAVLRALWDSSVARSRAAVAAALSADAADAALACRHPVPGGGAQVSLRWVLVHMIEEYARHNGHADLIRESLDGLTGA